jgi:hypothetical protein
MGQFDSPTEAALSILKSEDRASSPVGGKVEKFANLGGILLEAVGFTGASGGIGFLGALKNLAANKDEANLIYFGDALIEDIRRLYRLCEELKQQFDKSINSPQFSAAVANATLHITRTNVENRLKRLALLITNGVKEADIEPESLDDMMRAAAELKDRDISLLKAIYDKQADLLKEGLYLSSEWSQQVAANWSMHFEQLDSRQHTETRGSLARLQSFGFIAPVETMMTRNGSIAHQPFGLLLEGKKFYERLQEIAVQQ